MQMDTDTHAGETILTPDKIDLKPTIVTRDKEGHFIMTNISIH